LKVLYDEAVKQETMPAPLEWKEIARRLRITEKQVEFAFKYLKFKVHVDGPGEQKGDCWITERGFDYYESVTSKPSQIAKTLLPVVVGALLTLLVQYLMPSK